MQSCIHYLANAKPQQTNELVHTQAQYFTHSQTKNMTHTPSPVTISDECAVAQKHNPLTELTLSAASSHQSPSVTQQTNKNKTQRNSREVIRLHKSLPLIKAQNLLSRSSPIQPQETGSLPHTHVHTSPKCQSPRSPSTHSLCSYCELLTSSRAILPSHTVCVYACVYVGVCVWCPAELVVTPNLCSGSTGLDS